MLLRRVPPATLAQLISGAESFSTLPIPIGRVFVSAQAATYYDGNFLHVWYGAQVAGTDDDDLYYTRSQDLVHWSTPVIVIALAGEGIRDTDSIVERGNIYLFGQVYDIGTGRFDRIPLYRIPVGADYSIAANYTLIGNAVTLGAGGDFDGRMTASPAIVKVRNEFYLLYEASDNATHYSIGRSFTKDVESVPYIKRGPLLLESGEIMRNLESTLNAIVPCRCFDDNSLVFHSQSNTWPPPPGEHWNVGLVYHPTGDFSSNTGYCMYKERPTPTLPRFVSPKSAGGVEWTDWASVGIVGMIDGYFYYLIQGWETGGHWPPVVRPTLYLMRTPLHIVYPRHRSDRHTLKLSRKPY